MDSTTETVVGTVSVSDHGMYRICSESDVLKALKVEAFIAGANIINSIGEKQPDSLYLCFRVKAILIKRTTPHESIPKISVEKNQDTSALVMTSITKENVDKTDSLYTAEINQESHSLFLYFPVKFNSNSIYVLF